MRQHFNAKFDTAYYKLRQVLQSATRLITNCHGTCAWSTLKFWSTFQTISISSYRPLTSLTSYTGKLICIFTIFESLIIHSVCSHILQKFLLSKALKKIFSPPNSLCRKGANSKCIMGNSNHSILCIYTIVFSSTQIEKIIII